MPLKQELVWQMAENSTASNVDEPAKQKRARGRPRKHPREEDLEVRVEGKELALWTTRKDYRAEADEVIFSLSVACKTVPLSKEKSNPPVGMLHDCKL